MRDIDEIVSDFELLDDWEDRYRFLIELGRELPPMDEADMNEHTKVPGCVSQVWLTSRTDEGSPPRIRFAGQSDAHIVKGLVAVALSLYSGRTAPEILTLDAEALFARIGLQDHLTPQRSNGLRSMVRRIQADAKAAMEAA
ncbi:SufE family protein [Aureimonas phyllosphaerae]|uniref:Cysteine desulfuration protein SufE n=1 Tax=Aureimonas phyllosphaerae TaxID=1166078 RepID=A0A7W6BM12_9HYPH|nr:SufE family protein [Aureimonas phyllosphaerae]MBB3934478.1 cysteine desulfuration protein SufE [Aureimonas phyllosphaerae]MBB3958306.1 cysteine desulfuration protein SufE [Aureimonas phyllosphaerae]SFE95037.1 Cysteine desulfuration protein SufE [Aureimonas phyllosphaerae]